MAKSKQNFSVSYAVAFAIAILSISKFFGAYTYFQAYEDLKGYVVVVLSLSGFVLAMGFMAYKIYTEEKQKDNYNQRNW